MTSSPHRGRTPSSPPLASSGRCPGRGQRRASGRGRPGTEPSAGPCREVAVPMGWLCTELRAWAPGRPCADPDSRTALSCSPRATAGCPTPAGRAAAGPSPSGSVACPRWGSRVRTPPASCTTRTTCAGRTPSPSRCRGTLFGKGAVHTLDGEAHRTRKALFVSLLMDDDRIAALVGAATPPGTPRSPAGRAAGRSCSSTRPPRWSPAPCAIGPRAPGRRRGALGGPGPDRDGRRLRHRRAAALAGPPRPGPPRGVAGPAGRGRAQRRGDGARRLGRRRRRPGTATPVASGWTRAPRRSRCST
jgi:hypothetical protein